VAGRQRGARLERIEVRNASVRLGRHWALRDVSFEIGAGERWLLLGANGAGKTVLLKLLRGDIWPTPASRPRQRELRRYHFAGGDVDEQPIRAHEHIAYLGPERQDRYERYESTLEVQAVVLTGFDDSDFPLQRATATQKRRIRAGLARVGLAGVAARPFRSLSYGQRRRVLLARALVRGPDVLLLDEALNGLDAAGRRSFVRALRRAVPKHVAWILTSHRKVESLAGVTHVAHIAAGRIAGVGPTRGGAGTANVRRHPGMTREVPAVSPLPPGRAAVAKRGAALRRPLLQLTQAAVYRDERAVIAPFDWTLRKGEHWQVRGANGSGKSTLVALLYGDLWPAAGGRLERALPDVADWKNAVGLISPELQAAYAATGCTVEEIVASGFDASIGLNEWPTPARRRRVRQELRAWGLEALAARQARELSYGQLRLVLAARACVRQRRLYLLDEPFDGLDPAARKALHARLDAAVKRGATIVIATHHQEDVPGFVRNQLELRRGRTPLQRGSAAS
jgi:molybdate transport system ATP-binding protein